VLIVAPLFTRSFIILTCPLDAAYSKTVRLYLVFALISAPLFNSRATISVLPWSAAICSAVILSLSGADARSFKNRPFDYTEDDKKENYLKVIRTLSKRGKKLNHQNEKGATALSYAIKSNFPDVVNLLLVNGASLKKWWTLCYLDSAHRRENIMCETIIFEYLKKKRAACPFTQKNYGFKSDMKIICTP